MAKPYILDRRCFSKKFLVVAAIVVAAIIALAVGLAIGLTQSATPEAGDSSSEPLPSETALGNHTAPLWLPGTNATWQIVLQDPISLPTGPIEPNVDVFDIDLFTNSQDTIQGLQARGKKVICYFSAGSYEPYRPDSYKFQDGDLGSTMDGWPDERWLNIRTANVRQIMAARIKLAAQKGCSGIDPDNVDGYSNSNGLGLVEQDAIDFIKFMSQYAVSYGLAIGLKNAGNIVTRTAAFTDFSVNEQCVQYSECATFAYFIELGKPVFHIEYPQHVSTLSRAESNEFCLEEGNARGSAHFSTVLKNMDLDGFARYCNSVTAITKIKIDI